MTLMGMMNDPYNVLLVSYFIFIFAYVRVGRDNLSIFLHSTARENFKLMINGSLTIPIAQMALPLATPVAYLNELGNPGIV